MIIQHRRKVKMQLDIKLIRRPRINDDFIAMFDMDELYIIFRTMTVVHCISLLVFTVEVYLGNLEKGQGAIKNKIKFSELLKREKIIKRITLKRFDKKC